MIASFAVAFGIGLLWLWFGAWPLAESSVLWLSPILSSAAAESREVGEAARALESPLNAPNELALIRLLLQPWVWRLGWAVVPVLIVAALSESLRGARPRLAACSPPGRLRRIFERSRGGSGTPSTESSSRGSKRAGFAGLGRAVALGLLFGVLIGELAAQSWRSQAWLPDLDVARGQPASGSSTTRDATTLEARDQEVAILRVSLVREFERSQSAHVLAWPVFADDASEVVVDGVKNDRSIRWAASGAENGLGDWSQRRVVLRVFEPRRRWAGDPSMRSDREDIRDLHLVDCGIATVRFDEVGAVMNGAGFDAARQAFATGVHARATLRSFVPVPCAALERARPARSRDTSMRESVSGLPWSARFERRLRVARESADRRLFGSEGVFAKNEASRVPAEVFDSVARDEGSISLDSRPTPFDQVESDGGSWLKRSLTATRPEARGLARALVLGERDAISRSDWEALLGTGTNHLLAISGLHIALVAGAAAWMSTGLHAAVVWMHGWWFAARRSPLALRRWHIVLPCTLLAAANYAAMAGFSGPTQRALVMVVLASFALTFGGRWLSWSLWGTALGVVLLWQPAAILTPGLWFSFAAVALIYVYQSGRLAPFRAAAGLSLQLWLAIATIPIAGTAFGLWSTLAAPANVIAVPWISLVSLPLLLLGAALSWLWPVGGGALVDIGIVSLEPLRLLLGWMANLPGAVGYGDRPVALLSVWLAVLFLWWLGGLNDDPLFKADSRHRRVRGFLSDSVKRGCRRASIAGKSSAAAISVPKMTHLPLTQGLATKSEKRPMSALASVLEQLGYRIRCVGVRVVERGYGRVGNAAARALRRSVVIAALTLWLLVLWWAPRSTDIDSGAFVADFIDVGQGLAVLIRTQNHALLYDTGPPGVTVRDLLAVLEVRDVRRLDAIMISHEDLDHRGGLPEVRRRFPSARVWRRVETSTPGAGASGNADGGDEICAAGLSWNWDGVLFTVLHPGPLGWDASNAASCVLHVRGSGAALLLTGDLEGIGEIAAMHQSRESLSADVIQVPHHGARRAFEHGLLEASEAWVAINASGRRNAYGHPHPFVRERVEDVGAVWCDTGDWGRLTLRFNAKGLDGINAARGARRPWSAATPQRPSACAGDAPLTAPASSRG